MLKHEEIRFSNALKSVARNGEIKNYIQNSQELYPLFMRAAKRFVSGETRLDAINKAKELIAKDYLVSLEYIGENTTNADECHAAKEEFISLIHQLGANGIKSTISFDLSHIGMSVDRELALKNLKEMAQAAELYHLNLMISMEESEKTDRILDIYKEVASTYKNVGITIQVHLKRSLDDLNELFKYPGKIRIVKGAYQEPADLKIGRSEELNNRYLEFIRMGVEAEYPISIATHDEKLLEKVFEQGYLKHSNVELEMLDGVRPDLIKNAKNEGYKARVYVTYGTEWYLYLAHRIAEYPPNIYTAVSDIIAFETKTASY
ncbi:proline dehydrogenase family protein [Metabacillus indicus]|uniref:proline dehydrogenase family protein n=1 Tax=Metabacillus indicus TaxID=246786 RepID=UPI002A029FED|nr:proline dehydrogenase family protein [Metabacillus indicus]MDX8290775.1 proline dehydrogenase family protein [Metabacillus indicus]